jgi:isopenicillin-N epimerase
MTLKHDFLLDERIHFLNHGSFGAVPKPVFKAYQDLQLRVEREPVTFFRYDYIDMLNQARTDLANYIHAPVDTLMFMPNATIAMNLVAQALRLQVGNEIVSTNHEYGAMDMMWQFVARKTGAKYVPAPIPYPLYSVEQFTESVWLQVTPRTKVLFLSHITSPTALTFPIAELIQRAKAQGILTIIDGAHTVGQIDLDLEGLGADIYTSNCHKWLCAPRGSAFLTIRKELQDHFEPLVISWDYLPENDFVTQNRWQGTRELCAFLCVPQAIAYQQANDWNMIRAKCHELAQDTRQHISALTQLEPLSPDTDTWYQQMIALPLPKLKDEEAFKKALFARHIEVPITLHNGMDYIRVSYQAYNDQADADALLNALEDLLKQPQWF